MRRAATASRRDAERATVERLRTDPLWFVEEVLGATPWAKQREIVEAVARSPRVAVRSSHGIGKSWIAARIALAFLYGEAGSIVVTTAPTGRQVEKVLWSEIRSAHAAARYPLGGTPLTKELKLDDRWFAFGLSTKEPDAFQGIHARRVLVIIDEASGVESEIWNAIDGVLTSEECRLLAIGNPTDPTGRFAEECKSAGTKHIAVSAFDTPNFTTFGITLEDIRAGEAAWRPKITGALPLPSLVGPAWVAEKWHRWREGSPLWDARVMGNFPEQGTDTLVPLAWIERAQNAGLEATEPSELGVDVARFGDDETVIAHRRGPVVRIHSVSSKEDTQQTAGRVKLALAETGAVRAKVDDIGLGGGVTDRLREDKKPVVAINVSESASDTERFVNLRAELWWSIRERFQDSQIDIPEDDDELASQLASMKYKITGRGIAIESKQDAKARGIGSPDRADAVMLAFATKAVQTWRAV